MVVTMRDLLAQLSATGAAAVERRLVQASGGNLSVRVPGEDRFLVTRTGAWLDRLGEADFSLVGLSGELLEGPEPSSEHRVHLRVYERRPDVGAIVHLHQQMTVLVDAMGLEILPLTLDQAHYLRAIHRVGFFPNASWELGDAVGEAVVGSNAVVLAHHGSVTLGDTVDMAFRRALNLEEAAAATFHSHLAGRGSSTRFPLDAELPPEHSTA